MKRSDLTSNGCRYAGDVLAYLFGELSPEGRERFEEHLPDCQICVDEFAELSDARYSVYEWKSVEFAPLETPRFVLPSASAKNSWFDSIRTAFAWKGVALAGGLAAVLIFALLGPVLLRNADGDVIASDVENDVSPATKATAVPERMAVEDTALPAEIENATRTNTNSVNEPARTARRAVRPSTTKLAGRSRARTNSAPPRGDIQRLQNSATLGQYVDDKDESLRLSDLFDDLDTRDLE